MNESSVPLATTSALPELVSSDASENQMERRWVLPVSLAVMALTLLPYIIGWSFAQGRQFMWLGYNLDDSCVYLSWMRQAADGSLRALNLFTTESQHGMLLNPLFLVLGWIARLSGSPLLFIYHAARIVFGFGLLLLVWKFIRLTVQSGAARRLAFLCVCFGAGVGWLPFSWDGVLPSPTCPSGPIDFWQPEAITYLSLLLSPLFCFSMALQVAVLMLLFQGEQTGQIKYGIMAGLCGFVLGLTHTYDVVSLSGVWGVYLLAEFLSDRKTASATNIVVRWSLKASLIRAGCAGVITLPAVAYIYHELKTEVIFQQRANVETLSPSPVWTLSGYGLTLCFAAYAAYHLLRSQGQTMTTLPEAQPQASHNFKAPEHTASSVIRPVTALMTSRSAARLLIIWAVVNILVSYLPAAQFPFQRKMLQGAHFPIAILAGVGLAGLLAFPAVQRQIPNRKLAIGIALLLLGLTNIRFIGREITNYRDNHAQPGERPYLNEGEVEALEWISVHAPANAAIQPLPWVAKVGSKFGAADMSLACYAPGLIHHPVYCGHWGETPDYLTKLIGPTGLVSFMRRNLPDEQRQQILRDMKVEYLIFSQKNMQTASDEMFDLTSAPGYLIPVYSNHDADVYKVNLK